MGVSQVTLWCSLLSVNVKCKAMVGCVCCTTLLCSSCVLFLKVGVVNKARCVKLTRCHNASWIWLGVESLHVFGNEVSTFHTQFSSSMWPQGNHNPYTAKGSVLAYACVSSCQLSSEKSGCVNWTFRLTLEKFSILKKLIQVMISASVFIAELLLQVTAPFPQ